MDFKLLVCLIQHFDMIEKQEQQLGITSVGHCCCDMNFTTEVKGENVQYRKRASPDATPIRVSTRHIW